MADPLTSPGAAFAQQARIEHQLMRLMTGLMDDFLARVQQQALSVGLQLSPMWVQDTWRDMVTETLGQADWLHPVAGEYLTEAFTTDTDLPSEVFESTSEVLTTAALENWTSDTLRQRLQSVLEPETPMVVQAAGPVKRLWDKAKTVGASWRDRIQREVRTHATGLQGKVSMAILDERPDITRKRWVSRRDPKVRPTHVEADGQTVPKEVAFNVGGALLMYPGEKGEPPEEIANCRCVMVGIRTTEQGQRVSVGQVQQERT